MRPITAISILALLAGAIGCNLIGKNTEAKPTTTVQKVTSDQLVRFLDERASRLQAISAEVRFTAHDGLLSMSLYGDLSAAQSRYFRMVGKGKVGGSVDLGSNNEQFWIYLDAPTQKPLFVYASHADFESGRAKLPGNLPFEPEWVMQALGMHVFPPNARYNDPMVSQSERTYTLSWRTTTPNGMNVQKEVVFEADEARDGKPQVKKHLIRDSKNKLICSAEIKSVQSVPIPGTDAKSAQIAVQYPTHIVLRWEAQKFDLDLQLSNVQVNQRVTEEQSRRLFTRPPDIAGAQALDLAKYEFSIR